MTAKIIPIGHSPDPDRCIGCCADAQTGYEAWAHSVCAAAAVRVYGMDAVERNLCARHRLQFNRVVSGLESELERES